MFLFFFGANHLNDLAEIVCIAGGQRLKRRGLPRFMAIMLFRWQTLLTFPDACGYQAAHSSRFHCAGRYPNSLSSKQFLQYLVPYVNNPGNLFRRSTHLPFQLLAEALPLQNR